MKEHILAALREQFNRWEELLATMDECGARLILYPGMGHPASGKKFGRDVLAFFREHP